jgi:hypothetical protein
VEVKLRMEEEGRERVSGREHGMQLMTMWMTWSDVVAFLPELHALNVVWRSYVHCS